MEIKNKRGSEWRKWDLHVHTPESLCHNYKSANGNDVWETFISDLESMPAEIKVIGINDYLFIDGYKKVLEYKEKGRLQNIDLILPVVEFRLAKFCGHDQFKRINYHIIFSNEVSADIIQAQFLNGLSTKYKLDANSGQTNWGGVITKENLEKLGKAIKQTVPEKELDKYDTDLKEGFNNLNLEISDILEVLENAEQYFKGKYLTCIGKTEWDALNWNDSSIAEKKTIINSADIVFTASESIDNFNKAKTKLIDSNVNSLLLDCSDSHNNKNSQDKDRIGNCFTWIKADTTFEGLKQILYEPEERVRIQKTKPDEKIGYQVIDCVELNEDIFWKKKIYFNENLNTIIGGRSTGKSTLLKSIARKIDEKISDENFIADHLSGITVKWKDGEETASRDIDFFPQSYMHDIAKDKEKTNNLIQGIIKDTDKNKILSSLQTENENIKRNITTWILELFETNTKCMSLRIQLKESGDKKGVEAEIIRLEEKLTELNKHCTIQQTDIDAFNNSSQTIQNNNQNISQYENDLQIFSSLKNKSIISENYLYELYQLSDASKSEITTKFQELKNKVDAVWNKQIDSIISSTNQNIETSKKSITDIEQSEIYKKGVKYYSDNKELSDIQKKLSDEKIKLQNIETLEKQIIELTNQKKATLNNIVLEHIKYKQETEKVVSDLQIEYDELQITLNISFKKNELKEFIENRLNQRGYERQDFINTLIENYDTDTEKQLKNFLSKALNDEIEYKNYNNNQNVVNDFFTRNWYSLNYKLKYQNDVFSEMSQGKQAFVILKLLLEFSTKKCPILIDQPEDSLDNRAIYKELVQYLRAKKKERQIILVTHNPNVVVSADAENVIVANQNGKNSLNKDDIKFQYINGSLENTKQKDNKNKIVLESQGIREHVCEILEGGKEAFEKREQKYGFK
ncbi:MAG: ATP-binding protein [Bacteroidales bacterium]|jgi:predicted ATPase|nr:ATP-binding protein [Bacteroidales bacterium]